MVAIKIASWVNISYRPMLKAWRTPHVNNGGTVRARVPLPCPDTCRQVLGCTRPCTRVLLEAWILTAPHWRPAVRLASRLGPRSLPPRSGGWVKLKPEAVSTESNQRQSSRSQQAIRGITSQQAITRDRETIPQAPLTCVRVACREGKPSFASVYICDSPKFHLDDPYWCTYLFFPSIILF